MGDYAGDAWEPCLQVRGFFAGTRERMPKWPDGLWKLALRVFVYEVSQGGTRRDAGWQQQSLPGQDPNQRTENFRVLCFLESADRGLNYDGTVEGGYG